MFNREWFFHSEPLSGRRKTRPGIEIAIENEKFKPRMKCSSENDSFVGGRMFFVRSSENDFCLISGPSRRGLEMVGEVSFFFRNITYDFADLSVIQTHI